MIRKHEKPEFETHKQEIINSYLEREVTLRQAARHTMHVAEADFKLAAEQYALSSNVIDDLLQDLVDVEEVPGFAQFDET